MRDDQRDEPIRGALPQIVDTEAGLGSAGGILSAQEVHPEAAWLVVACDLPFLDEATLRRLLDERDVAREATGLHQHSRWSSGASMCYLGTEAGNAALKEFMRSGIRCPHKILINSDTRLLEQSGSKSSG